jgi:hypothetical protein
MFAEAEPDANGSIETPRAIAGIRNLLMGHHPFFLSVTPDPETLGRLMRVYWEWPDLMCGLT